ncbi:MAG: hypothetical protein ACOC0J_02300, partial [Myxococcota bacterium]
MSETTRANLRGRSGRLAAVIFTFLSSALAASSATAILPDAELGLVPPGLTGALAEDALAPRVNPAGLGFMEGTELQLLHMRVPGAWTTDLRLGVGLGPLALGFGQEWLDGPDIGWQRRSSLSLALGDRSFSLGGTVRRSRPAGAEDSLSSYDVGAAGRMYPWLSWSASMRDIDVDENAAFTVGLGVRLLRDRVTAGVERIWPRDERFFASDGFLAWALRLRLLDGLPLSGSLSHPLADLQDLRLGLALTLNLPTVGFTGGHLPLENSETSYASLRLSSARHRSPLPTRQQVLFDLEEALTPIESFLMGAEQADLFLDLVRLLDQARRDSEIDAVVFRTAARVPLSFSQVEELRMSIEELQGAGKPVYFYLDAADDWIAQQVQPHDIV